MNKKLTLGARGFVLESAITDDGDVMRVSGRKAWAEGVVLSRVPINLESISDRTPDTALHLRPPPFRVLPRYPFFVYALVE